MGGGVARIASPAVEKIARSASSNVDAVVLGQAEIENFRAAVIERNALTTSDFSQLLVTERRRHCDIFVHGQNRIAEESQSRGKGIGRQDQRLCPDRMSVGGMENVLRTLLDVSDGGVLINLSARVLCRGLEYGRQFHGMNVSAV